MIQTSEVLKTSEVLGLLGMVRLPKS